MSTAGRDLDQLQPILAEAEDAALRHEQHRLAVLGREPPAEGDVLDRLDELGAAPFLEDRQPPVADLDLQPAGREGADEDELAGVLRDVDEAARAREPAAEAADIDVAVPVGLREAEAGEVEAAAVVEVELLVLVDDRVGVDRRPEVEPALRQAADDAGLGGERDEVEELLLGGDGRDALRHADAEVDDAAERQLEGAAARDHLALVEGQRRDAVDRRAHLAGEGGVVGGARRSGRGARAAATTTQSTSAPGILTSRGLSVPAAAIRSTWTMTRPLEFLAAMAMARLSSVSASRSMVTLPWSSAVVPRRIATWIGKAL